MNRVYHHRYNIITVIHTGCYHLPMSRCKNSMCIGKLGTAINKDLKHGRDETRKIK